MHLLELSTTNNTLHIVTIALISWAAAITVAIAIMVAVVIRKASLIKTRARRLAGMKLRASVVDSDWGLTKETSSMETRANTQELAKESGSQEAPGEIRGSTAERGPAGVRARRLVEDYPADRLPPVEDARPSVAAAALADRLMNFVGGGGWATAPNTGGGRQNSETF